jgi:fibronectin type 3 domain-containing protein
LTQKKLILAVSLGLVLLTLASCGKKANPIPKGLPVPTGIGDLRGDVRDGVLFISFSIPGKNMDGTELRDLKGFKILKSCGGCGGGFAPWKDIRLTDRKGYTIRDNRIYVYDDDVREGFTYAYRVYAYSSKVVQGESSNIFSLTWVSPPDAPKQVKAEGEDGRVNLAWEKEDDTSYDVYRWEGATYPLFPLNTVLLTESAFTDSKLRNGETYTYEVRAVKTVGGVPFEGEGVKVSATPRSSMPPAPPAGLKPEKKGKTVLLSWAANTEGNIAGYNLYRVVAGKARKINNEPVAGLSFIDRTSGSERYVSYYATAVDQNGNESRPSKEEVVILED